MEISDGLFLYLVLVALYLFECIRWFPVDAWVFRSSLSGSSSLVDPKQRAETLAGAPTLLNPLRPLATAHIALGLRFILTDDGIVIDPPRVLPGLKPKPEAPTFLPFATLGSIDVEEKSLHFRDHNIRLRLSSKRATRIALESLQLLGSTSPAARAAQRLALWSATFDHGAYATRLAHFRTLARPLAYLSTSLTLFTLLLAPLLLFRFGPSFLHWTIAIGGSLALSITTSVLYLKAHRALEGAKSPRPLQDAIVMATCPTVAMRALDILATEVLAGAHPALAASLLLNPKAGATLLAAYYRELIHPRSPLDTDTDGALATHRAFNAYTSFEITQLTALLLNGGITPADALHPDPTQLPSGTQSHCPRCHQPFTRPNIRCEECNQPATPYL